jgi:hypothetical protein
VDEVADALAGLGPVRREDPPGVEESYKFTLPPMPPLRTARRNGDGLEPSAVEARTDTEVDLDSDVDDGSEVVEARSEVVDGAEVTASTVPDASTGS